MVTVGSSLGARLDGSHHEPHGGCCASLASASRRGISGAVTPTPHSDVATQQQGTCNTLSPATSGLAFWPFQGNAVGISFYLSTAGLQARGKARLSGTCTSLSLGCLWLEQTNDSVVLGEMSILGRDAPVEICLECGGKCPIFRQDAPLCCPQKDVSGRRAAASALRIQFQAPNTWPSRGLCRHGSPPRGTRDPRGPQTVEARPARISIAQLCS